MPPSLSQKLDEVIASHAEREAAARDASEGHAQWRPAVRVPNNAFVVGSSKDFGMPEELAGKNMHIKAVTVGADFKVRGSASRNGKSVSAGQCTEPETIQLLRVVNLLPALPPLPLPSHQDYSV